MDFEQQHNFKQGENVWATDDELAWVQGVISSVSGNNTFKVKLNNGSTVKKSGDELLFSSIGSSTKQLGKIEDVTKLPDLHDASLLQTLDERFHKDKIYTKSSNILIAVNPFKYLPKLYDAKRMLQYLDASISEREYLAPHSYAIAHNAYEAMKNENGRNQSILVSGESGAGKTVSTKHVLSYLTVVSASNKREALELSKRSSKKRHDAGVSQRVLEANPMMEAFGNAKTLRNDNSSRFGKMIQLQFSQSNFSLETAAIDIYLLEKSRVTHQIPGERNYHIFYEMDKGLDNGRKAALQWPSSINDCRYLSNGAQKRSDISDKKQFEATMNAFRVVGISSEEEFTIFSLMSAILHLGNIEFESTHENGEEGSKVKKRSKDSLKACAQMLQVDDLLLENCLTTHAINVGGGGVASVLSTLASISGESYVKRHTVEQACEARDGMAMTLYDRMFAWIVWKINESLASTGADLSRRPSSGRRSPSSKNNKGKKGGDRVYYNDFSIGCLDIFGFEVFEKNSFEQLLINYTNEQLQCQFNEFVFELEQAEYKSEGIDWTVISFPDNSKCLEMIESRPIGLLALIDEECLYPKGSDQSLGSKLGSNLGRRYKDYFTAVRRDNCFTINHFAGMVTYSVDGFCKKNKNELRQEAVDLLRSSTNELFKIILPPDAASAGGGADAMEYFTQMNTKKSKRSNYRSSLERHRVISRTTSRLQSKTVSAHFKTQLNVAMNHIRASQPHYIRCLKSNDENVAGVFDRMRIEEQLRYSGVLEVVKVTRAGYSSRFMLKDFAHRFSCIQSIKAARKTAKSLKKGDARSVCEKILADSGLTYLDDYQVGNTKVFLKPHAYSALEVRRADALHEYVVVLQRAIRSYLLWKRVNQKVLERRAKRKPKRRSMRTQIRSVTKIQAAVRGMITRGNLEAILIENQRRFEEAQAEARRIHEREEAELRRQREELERKIEQEKLELERQRQEMMRKRKDAVKKMKKEKAKLEKELISQEQTLTRERAKRIAKAKKMLDSRKAEMEEIRAQRERANEKIQKAWKKLESEREAELSKKRKDGAARIAKAKAALEQRIEEEEKLAEEAEHIAQEITDARVGVNQLLTDQEERLVTERGITDMETSRAAREIDDKEAAILKESQDVAARIENAKAALEKKRRDAEEAIFAQRKEAAERLAEANRVLEEGRQAEARLLAQRKRLKKERIDYSAQQQFAMSLQQLSTTIEDQGLLGREYSTGAARQIQGVARMIAKEKTKEMLVQEEEAEERGDTVAVVPIVAGLAVLASFVDIKLLIISAVGLLIGGSFVLESSGKGSHDAEEDDDRASRSPSRSGRSRSRLKVRGGRKMQEIRNRNKNRHRVKASAPPPSAVPIADSSVSPPPRMRTGGAVHRPTHASLLSSKSSGSSRSRLAVLGRKSKGKHRMERRK